MCLLASCGRVPEGKTGSLTGRQAEEPVLRFDIARQAEEPVLPSPSPSTFSDARERGLPEDGLLLVVDTATQSAGLHARGAFVVGYKVSTSKFGTGNAAGSNKTPLGWHRVATRFGEGQEPGTSFTSRQPDGEVLPKSEWSSDKAKDYILTRVLWLTGLEPGVNSGRGIDSYERYIYLYGTNQEHLLGQPASQGCIRFSNRDILDIFLISKDVEFYVLIK